MSEFDEMVWYSQDLGILRLRSDEACCDFALQRARSAFEGEHFYKSRQSIFFDVIRKVLNRARLLIYGRNMGLFDRKRMPPSP